MAPAERRAQLLRCAVTVFARRGLGAARPADVAAEAGVSQPAVFVYFSSRPALVAAVLGEVERYYLAMLRDAHRRDGSARDVLLSIARAFAASVDGAPAHARIWLDWSTAMREELWPRYLRFQRRVLRLLAATIARGQRDGTVALRAHPEDAARLMYAAAYAVLQMKLDAEPGPRIERFLGSVVDAVAPALASVVGAERAARRRALR
jgi:TetR/AcrR family hemagglutinin/protease transcriptional regulator